MFFAESLDTNEYPRILIGLECRHISSMICSIIARDLKKFLVNTWAKENSELKK